MTARRLEEAPVPSPLSLATSHNVQPLPSLLFSAPSRTDLVFFVAAVEQRSAAEELVHDAAQGPRVNLRIVLSAEDNLGRTVEAALNILVHLHNARAEEGGSR